MATPDDTPEQYREYLHTLLRMRADPWLNGKVDLSGIVQKTLLEAAQNLPRWREMPEGERMAWLRTVLANNHADEVRKFRTQARDAGREVSIEQSLADSSARIAVWLAADQSSPSARTVRNEDLLRLTACLAQLLDDQRRAVELHHLGGLPIAATADEMGKSPQAVVGLLRRGLERLRELMG